MSVYTGLALTQAAGNVQNYNRDKPEREARREEAKARQQKSKEYLANEPVRQTQSDVELVRAQTELKQLHSNNLTSSTYQAFDRYENEGDIRHLKNFISEAKQNPAGQRMYANMTTVDKITRTPQTEAQLAQQGITDIDGFFENPDQFGNFVLATAPDGSQTVVDMDNIYKSTGYTKYASTQALDSMKTRQTTTQLAKFGISYKDMDVMTRAANMIKDEMNVPLHEAIAMLTKAKANGGLGGAGKGSNLGLAIAALQEENPGMSYMKALRRAVLDMTPGNAQSRESKERQLDDENKSREQTMVEGKAITQSSTSKAKNLAQAEGVRDQLDSLAGEGKDFFDLDLNDRGNRAKASRLITSLESLTGAEFSAADKKAARQYRKVLSLSNPAAKLTAAETGLFDNLLHDVRQYITDNVDGTEATTAYETIRNAIRHDLFGATLPEGEMRAFNKSLGGLGKQLGPIMAQLKVTMETTKAELQSIYDLNDEMIAQFYLGVSLDKVEDVIDNIDRRIRYVTTDKVGDIQQKRELNDILFGSNK